MNLCELSMIFHILKMIFIFQTFEILLLNIENNIYCKVTNTLILSYSIYFYKFYLFQCNKRVY